MSSRASRGRVPAFGEVLLHGRASVLLISLAVAAFAFNSIEMAPLGILPHMIRDLGLTAQEGGAMTAGYAAVIALSLIHI